MPFNSVNKQFADVAAFAAWLTTLPPPDWQPTGSTYHNTFVPTLTQWRGLTSIRSMQAHYETLGWTAGPHVFIALGAPTAAHNGIFVMTPPTHPGVHSPSCNSGLHGRFGVEMVGDYNAKPPTPDQRALLIAAIAELHRYAGLGPNLNAHRDCDPRTCPGDAFYAIKPELQAGLADALDPLRARMLPGAGGTTKYCGTGFYDLYTVGGGFATYGYALTDEAPALGQDTRPCTFMRWERAIAKYVEGDGVRLALLSEARAQGWLP
jgi:hypothetical protein